MRRLNRSAEAERRIQDRIETVIAGKHERRLRTALMSMYRGAADAYRSGGITDSAVMSERDRIDKTLRGIWETAYTSISDRVAGQIAEATGKSLAPERKQMSDVRRRALDLFIQRWAAKKVTQVTSTTMTEIGQIIKRGIEDGLSVDELAGRIMQTGKIYAAYRAPLIARTETHGAAQYGSLQAAEESEVVEMKEWIAVEDSRTRGMDNEDYDHVNVASVPVKEPFIVSGEPLMYPGDPAGSPGNTISCRCVMGYLIE